MRCAWTSLVALALSIAVAQEALGQTDLSSHRPRFLAASSPGGTPVDASNAAVLRRRITLAVTGGSMDAVLKDIARQADLELMFSKAVLPQGRPVTLHASDITVGAALTEVLWDTGLDVLLLPGGQMGLVRRPAEQPVRVAGGTVSGRVTDVKTGQGLAGTEVLLEKAGRRTLTGEDGRYRIADVELGSYMLTVRRIGYAKRSLPVTVIAEQEVTVDVALEPVPTTLDEIVTTVTGEQRVRELGHVVGRINADSLVKAAPVASVTELLNARVPGMQVFTGQGTVGGDASIRIRGATTALLNQEPIVIVDGVRYTSDRKVPQGSISTQYEPTSRLNDLNPNDIGTIEVVKGPSAATLYGTDAVNGVIVITTKRGQLGRAQWNTYARASRSEIPVQSFPNGSRGWSSSVSNCRLAFVAQGTCTQDSVTTMPSPLNDPELTMFGSAPRLEYGANVSGGGSGIRYFVSGDFEDATGPLHMPLAVVEQLKETRGVSELPEEQLRPNAFTKLNLRSNISIGLGRKLDLQVSTGYTQNATRTTRTGLSPYTNGVFQGTPDNPYGANYSPGQVFSMVSTERTSRFTGSLRLDARPWSWLAAWGSVGLDLASITRHGLAKRGEGASGYTTGAVDDNRRRDLLTTADMGTRATFQFGRLSSRTAVGAQYVRTLYDGVAASGSGLPPGGETVASATSQRVSTGYAEAVTLGGYLEETVGLNERLFLTGALRADGGSTFGRDYKAVVYPKGSVSWIVSDEPFLPRVPGLDELRLRYAYGASGRQPTTVMSIPGYTTTTVFADGKVQTGVVQYTLGNRHLRPEQTREHEFGFDGTLLDGRVRLEGTWYFRRTVDGIQSMALQPGYGSIFVNLGLVKDRGFEGRLSVRPIDTRALSWELSLQHSSNTNQLIDLGDQPPVYAVNGGLVQGYPIGARFMAPLVGYEDTNGNGIIERSEVTIGDSAIYLGPSMPAQTQTLATVVGLLKQRVRLSALFDRRAGFTQWDFLGQMACTSGYCRAAVDPSTPLAEQAEVAALGLFPSGQSGAGYGFVDDASFVRLREVSIAVDLPDGLVRAARLRHATLGLSARNVAMWSSYRGVDVESVVGAGYRTSGDGGTANGIPQARSWVLRLDIGF